MQIKFEHDVIINGSQTELDMLTGVDPGRFEEVTPRDLETLPQTDVRRFWSFLLDHTDILVEHTAEHHDSNPSWVW